MATVSSSPHANPVASLIWRRFTDSLGSKREFSFTLEDDIYIRYLSFQDANGWQQECLKRLPHKMDMGAIFSAPVATLLFRFFLFFGFDIQSLDPETSPF